MVQEKCFNGNGCVFKKAFDTLEGLNNLDAFKKFAREWYTNDLPFGGKNIGGRPRNFAAWGPPSCGKSLLEQILLFCIPESRIFSLKTGGFPFDGCGDVPSLLVARSVDFRLEKELKVEPMLLACEGKPFPVDNKGRPCEEVSGPIVFIIGTNRFDEGWSPTDIRALHARFIIQRMVPIPEEMRIKNMVFCNSCAKELVESIVDGSYTKTGTVGEPQIKRQHVMGDLERLIFLRDNGVVTPRSFDRMKADIMKGWY